MTCPIVMSSLVRLVRTLTWKPTRSEFWSTMPSKASLRMLASTSSPVRVTTSLARKPFSPPIVTLYLTAGRRVCVRISSR